MAENNIVIKEGLTGVSAKTPYFNLFLDKSKNHTLEYISLNNASNNTMIEKTGLSYLSMEKSRYQTEYSRLEFKFDNFYKKIEDNSTQLIFLSHNSDFEVKKTYTLYKDLPLCLLSYEIKTQSKKVEIGPAYFPRLFFPLQLDHIIYPIEKGAEFDTKITLKNGKIYDVKLNNPLFKDLP